MAVSDSEFNMWRTIIALAHADQVVTDQETSFLKTALADVAFTTEQREILDTDIAAPHDIAALFDTITDHKDRSRFFYFARLLFWSDGDFSKQEQEILTRLGRTHHKSVDFAALLQSVRMELEADQDLLKEDGYTGIGRKGFGGALRRFLRRKKR